MFEMHCRENFILITFQFSAGKPAKSWASASCTSCPGRLDSLSSGTPSPPELPHSRGWKAPQRPGHCLGVSCPSPQRRLEMEMEHVGNISPLQPLVPPPRSGFSWESSPVDGAVCLPQQG